MAEEEALSSHTYTASQMASSAPFGFTTTSSLVCFPLPASVNISHECIISDGNNPEICYDLG